MSTILSFLISIVMLFESIPLMSVPTLIVDASAPLGEVSTKATGFLYGLSEPGVPSEAMTRSLDISSVSQKVIDGLQHPTGDISHVIGQLEDCDYTVVYLQDAFSTWYYCYDEIMRQRSQGSYDWESFITQVYFPLVEEKVTALMNTPYSDKIVYCIYNECDNGVWFGSYADGNVHYDEAGRESFYKAWKMTYELVKELHPEALIGGPGFCDYEATKQRGFMEFVAENDCVPEIMIYHELAWWSTYDWQMHVEDYREIERQLGITPALPIIVTEYGTMEDCGNPARMLQYMYQIENTGTWANMAYWRLANNLNDTCADDNSPNSNWWLYRKYAELQGQRLSTELKYRKHSDLHDGEQWYYSYKGIAAINDEKDELQVIALGSDNKRAVRLTGLGKTALGSKVDVKVECVYFSGLTGIVTEPFLLRQYTARPCFGELNINIPGTDTDAVYFITVSTAREDTEAVRCSFIPRRYEFEQGTLLGDAYTYDSAYATTGLINGMVGGLEKQGDGVKINIQVPRTGYYNFDVIFGNSNDGTKSSDRDYTTALFTLDSQQQELLLPNTIKSEYTDCHSMVLYLTAGCHTVAFSHKEGTFVLDSALLYPADDNKQITLLDDGENAFLAIAPYDGYYRLTADSSFSGTVDGITAELENGSLIYLRRGLNEITCDKTVKISLSEDTQTLFSEKITAGELELHGSATLSTDKYGVSFVEGISSESGSADFTLTVPETDSYRVTLSYASNEEGGYHTYNVDLIESLLTVEVNGKAQDIFCRSTYSSFTYKTLTFTLELEQGENTVRLSSSGNIRFDGRTTNAPLIEALTVNQVA